MRNRWLLSTACGLSLLAGSATMALAQNVPTENAAAPTGTGGSASQVIQLKPGQEAGYQTVMPEDTAGNPNASMSDAQFVKRASAGGMAEVMMGHLAMRRGETEAVRQCGQMLVTDHTRANTQLMGIAQTSGLQPAPGPMPMQKALYQRLKNAPADQFDAMFVQSQAHLHRRMIAMFNMEGQDGQSAPLKQFAVATVPVLQKHLMMAEQLSKGMSSGGGMSMMNNGGGMSSGGSMGGGGAAITAPVSGNPDTSADQLNARELNPSNPS